MQPGEHPSFHPGKCARSWWVGEEVGILGELHPLVRAHYDLPETPLLAAELDLEAILGAMPEHYPVQAVPAFPPVLEDLAVIVLEEACPRSRWRRSSARRAGQDAGRGAPVRRVPRRADRRGLRRAWPTA